MNTGEMHSIPKHTNLDSKLHTHMQTKGHKTHYYYYYDYTSIYCNMGNAHTLIAPLACLY